MLHRRTDTGTLLVSQPAHAWISGQLAAAWGNPEFGLVEPLPEVCLAAEQHDIGWLEWESAPTLNPATGLPRTFRELPTLEHVGVWAPAGPRALVYGPYVALLVSLHGTGLYQHHDFTRDTIEEAEAAQRFMSDGAAFETQLTMQMQAHTRYAPFTSPESVDRNRRLVAVWDALSLALCGGIDTDFHISNIPTTGEPLSLNVRRILDGQERFSVEPWPFAKDEVGLTCTGRLINDTFTNTEAMRDAIDAALWVSVNIELAPARRGAV